MYIAISNGYSNLIPYDRLKKSACNHRVMELSGRVFNIYVQFY